MAADEDKSEIRELNEVYELGSNLEEDAIWSRDVAPLLKHLPPEVFGIWR